jgi:hypothetical protein
MFITVGNTPKDCCNHEHPTRDEAQACLVKYQNELRRAGKVSHRVVLELESLEELDDLY